MNISLYVALYGMSWMSPSLREPVKQVLRTTFLVLAHFVLNLYTYIFGKYGLDYSITSTFSIFIIRDFPLTLTFNK